MALVSVAFSATTIVVKTLQKLFEGCGGDDDEKFSTTENPMLATRPRGKTRAELEAARREIEALRKAATPRAATPSSPASPASAMALEMATLPTAVAVAVAVAAPALATPRRPRGATKNEEEEERQSGGAAEGADVAATTAEQNEEDGEEWSTVWSEEHQRHYYVHNATQATAWELPS